MTATGPGDAPPAENESQHAPQGGTVAIAERAGGRPPDGPSGTPGVDPADGAPAADDRETTTRTAVIRRVWQGGPGTGFLVVCCAFAVAFSIWLTWGIWRDGVPTGGDVNAHLIRTQYAFDHLFSHGQLDGWQSAIGLGYQQFLFNGPVFTVAVALVKALSLGVLSTLDAFKLVIVISFCLLPLSVALLAGAAGLGRRAAGIAAILALTVNLSTGGIGVDSVFSSGLVVNHFSSPFVFCALAAVAWVLRRPTWERGVLTGVAFAVLTVTHGLATMITAFLALALVLSAGVEWVLRNPRVAMGAWRDWRAAEEPPAVGPDGEVEVPEDDQLPAPRLWPLTVRVLMLALGGALAAGLAAFVLLPIGMHPELRGPITAYADSPLLSETFPGMWEGVYIFRPNVAKLVLLGLVVLLVRWRRRPPLSLALVLAPFVYLVLAEGFVATFPTSTVSYQLTVRSYAYAAMVGLLPLAAVLGGQWRSTRRTPALLALFGLRRVARHRLLAEGLTPFEVIIPFLVAVAIVLFPADLRREMATTGHPSADLAAAADVLRQVVPPEARFAAQAVQGEGSSVGHGGLWAAWASGRNTLTMFNLESSTVPEAGYTAHDLTNEAPAEKAAKLARYGVTHVLVLDEALAGEVPTAPEFRVIWRQGTAIILEVLPTADVPDPAALVAFKGGAGGGRATVTQHDSQHLDFRIESPRATTVSLAVAWSPKWEVTVGGNPVRAVRDGEGLLVASVSPGTTDVTIRYGQDRWDLIGRALTLLTLVALVVAVVVARRRGRASESESDSEPGIPDDPVAEHADPVDLQLDDVARAEVGC